MTTPETTAACVRGCKLYRRHLDECEGAENETCRGCLPRRANHGLLCDTCHRRLELMLHDAPTVYRWLTGNMSSGDQASRMKQDFERCSGGEKGVIETPVPMKIEVLDLRDLLADQLTEWVDEWCEKHGLTGPARHGVEVDVAFLRMWLPGIERLDWIGDWWETMAETMSLAHALAPWRPVMRRIPKVACPGCAETNLAIYGGESDISCLSCGIMMTEDRFEMWQEVLKLEEVKAS